MRHIDQIKRSPFTHAIIAFLVVIITFSIIRHETNQTPQHPPILDLEAIQKRGKLVVLTQYSMQSFFIYKGEPKGYEYELLELFAKEIGVSLEIRTTSDYDSLFTLLRAGKGDLIASHITYSDERAQEFLFSEPHATTRQVLIQRKPKNFEALSPEKLNQCLIRVPAQLVGKKVYLLSHKADHERVKRLSQLAEGEIKVKYAKSDLDAEDLLTLIAEGAYDYTVMQETVFKGLSPFYDNLDGLTALSPPRPVVWVFNDQSMLLRDAASQWISTFKSTNPTQYATIYNRYFGSERTAKRFNSYLVTTLPKGTISNYDELFKEYESSHFPWSLLAAISFQESQFDPQANSSMGARGLMQMMPSTMNEMKKAANKRKHPVATERTRADTTTESETLATDTLAIAQADSVVAPSSLLLETTKDSLPTAVVNPKVKKGVTAQEIRQNVRLGAKYLRHLRREYWAHMPDSVALQFTLASYNAGIGHIRDAQYLAHRLGYDSTLWTNNVEKAVLKLQRRKYYNLSGIKNGYLRGIETYTYVRHVLERHSQYEQHLVAVNESRKK